MTGLLHSHSGLRYLILLVGVAALVVYGLGLMKQAPWTKGHRILGASYAGLLHTQALVGLVMVAMGRYFPALIGHIVLMLLAAAAAQVPMTLNKKRAAPGHRLPLLGVGGSLLLIVGGVMAIGRGLFQATVFPAGQ